MNSMRDPVCGMPVDAGTSIVAELGGTRFRFCSEFCRQQFVRHPGAYNGGTHAQRQVVSWAERRVAYFTMEIALESKIVYLEDYDLDVGLAMVAGSDLWLNTPQRPLEASGTSGMKAAHNGVPSLSIVDGWWREGHIEGVTGWSIGGDTGDDASDALGLYRKLEEKIVPMFYEHRDAWVHVMKQAIALNASFFNTHRMVRQYVDHAYAVQDGAAHVGG